MRISPHKLHSHKQSGFSLLEILVVLAIMGLMLSIVGTRLVNSVDAANFSRTTQAAIADIKIVRADAMLAQRSHILLPTTSIESSDTSSDPNAVKLRYNLPANWAVMGDEIIILKTGVCLGGRVIITNPEGRKVVYALSPPRCEPQREIIPLTPVTPDIPA